MQNERKRILEMLARNEIGVDQADKMLTKAGPGPALALARKKLRYLYIIISKADEPKDRVNIRIPLKLLAHGLKITKLMPARVRDKVNVALTKVGLHFSITQDSILDFIDALTDLSVDIEDGERVRIYCQ